MGILDIIMEEDKNEKNLPEIEIEEDKIDGSLCPHCKIGRLWRRHSKFGEFYGCSNFPKCAYKVNSNYNNDIGSAGHKL